MLLISLDVLRHNDTLNPYSFGDFHSNQKNGVRSHLWHKSHSTALLCLNSLEITSLLGLQE